MTQKATFKYLGEEKASHAVGEFKLVLLIKTSLSKIR